MPKSKCPVFMCYRREDGEWCAEWLFDLLNGHSLENGGQDDLQIDLFFDKMIPAVADWREHHLPAMQSARAFILISTPGAKTDLSKTGQPDWVHEEILWWINNRRTAPIIVDTTADGERWIPDEVSNRWPNTNRIEVTKEQVEHATQDPKDTFLARTRERLLKSIVLSGEKIAFEDLARLQRLSKRLRRGLTAAVIAFGLATSAAFLAFHYFNQSQDRGERLVNQLVTSARLTGEGLAYRGLASMHEDPALAFRMAFEGSRFDPSSTLPNAVMMQALMRTPVWRRIVPPETWQEQLFLQPPPASAFDRISVDPEFQFLITGVNSREDDNGNSNDRTLYLYRLKDSKLLDQRTLADHERFVAQKKTVGRFYAVDRTEDGGVNRDYYLLNSQDWDIPYFTETDVKEHECHPTNLQCYILRDDGTLFRVSFLQGNGPPVQRETITTWSKAEHLSLHPSKSVLLLWNAREVRWCDLEKRIVMTVYVAKDGNRVSSVDVGVGDGELLVSTLSLGPEDRLTLEAIDPEGTHHIVSTQIPSLHIMGDNIAGILSTATGGRRVALTYVEERWSEPKVKIIDIEWNSESGTKFSHKDHGPLDVGREAATFHMGGILALTPDGNYLLQAKHISGTSGTTSTGGELFSWDLSPLSEKSTLRPVPAHVAGVHAPVIRVSFDHDGSHFLIWDARGISHIFKQRIGAPPIFQQRTRLPEEYEQRFFQPDITQWDQGKLSFISYSLSDKRYIDLESGIELKLDTILGKDRLLDSFWLDPPKATFTFVSQRSVLAVRGGSVENELIFEEPPAKAWVNEHGVVLGFKDRISVLDVGTLIELANIKVNTPPIWLWIDSHYQPSTSRLYAQLEDGSYRLWSLDQKTLPEVKAYPVVTPEGSGNAFSFRVSGSDLLISYYQVEETSNGFAPSVEQPLTEIKRFSLVTGKKLPNLNPPKQGWPDRPLLMERMIVSEDGRWNIVFREVVSERSFIGIWAGLDDKAPKWYELGDIEVKYMQTDNASSVPFAVVSVDENIRIISLVDGSVMDEGEYPLGGKGLLPRVSIDSRKPQFVWDRHFKEASSRLARGGLDSHLPITNVDLDGVTKQELDELFQTLIQDRK